MGLSLTVGQVENEGQIQLPYMAVIELDNRHTHSFVNFSILQLRKWFWKELISTGNEGDNERSYTHYIYRRSLKKIVA